MSTVPRPLIFSREIRRIHCLGVGGMGVAPLAVFLRQLGFTVSGEDDALSPEVRTLLEREGVALGGLPADAELVAHSSAIAPSHPAYAAARERGLPLVRRGELLAEVVRGRKLVAVCGSHGKTTTTAMLITALRRAGFPAGYVLGGLFADGTPPASCGEGEWVVAEIDESDGTIDCFVPEITVAVNLDWDHPDRYRSLADLERTFRALFGRTRDTVLVSEACPTSRRIAQELEGMGAGRIEAEIHGPEFLTFGPAGDFSGAIAEEAGPLTALKLGGRFAVGEAQVQAHGRFNAANATAALAAAQLMGVAPAPRLLADYPGVRRRQSVLYSAGGVTVIEDYAHHPAEIRALLGSLRPRLGGGGRLIVAFQPHRYSRTAQFKSEFASALATADHVLLLDVYPAGEAPVAGGTAADIGAEFARQSPARAITHLPAGDAGLFQALEAEVRGGDLVAFVGAGDIDRMARRWLAARAAPAVKATRWDEFVAIARPLLSPAASIRREEPLASRTTIRIGGAARVFAEPAGIPDLQAILATAAAAGVRVFLLGRGSNLLIPDEGVDGVVVSLTHPAWAAFAPRPGGRVWAGAGLRLKNLCGLAAKAGLVGFEFLEGIPGSVGGALRMNAGAMGGWMYDVVDEVQLMQPDGAVRTLPRAAMHVQYRYCAELAGAIALGALLRPVAQADQAAVNRQIEVYRRKRQETQPREPSAGCVFKNPPGNSAGRLIDESGLKGTRVGDAEVSSVHANFIVNRGDATGADVLELVRRIRARVREAKGVELEPEVLLYGKEWRDVL